MTRRLILIAADADTGEVMQAGKPSGLVIKQKELNDQQVENADRNSLECVFTNGRLVGQKRKSLGEVYKALLSASRVDLSGAEVKRPTPFIGIETITDPYQRHKCIGHNACLDAITAQMKGE